MIDPRHYIIKPPCVTSPLGYFYCFLLNRFPLFFCLVVYLLVSMNEASVCALLPECTFIILDKHLWSDPAAQEEQCMVGDVNMFLTDPSDLSLAELEIMIAGDTPVILPCCNIYMLYSCILFHLFRS